MNIRHPEMVIKFNNEYPEALAKGEEKGNGYIVPKLCM